MPRLFLSLNSFLFLLSAMLSPVAGQPTGNPFLWEINGSGARSYLFGTIHIPDQRVAELPDLVQQAFDSSEAVYTEIPLDTASLMAQARYVQIPGSDTLQDILPPDLLARTERTLQSIQPTLSIALLNKFKVWAIAQMVPILGSQLKNPFSLPMDARLYQEAERDGKMVGAIETIEEQVALLDSLSQQEQIKMLVDTLDQFDQARADGVDLLEQIIQPYLSGNLSQFGKVFVEYGKEDEFSERFLKKILYDRNERMADRIAHLLQENPGRSYFFAVGAGHYWGDTGIQELLSRKGFSIERISR